MGILTFHRAINYGAVLQAYALQQVILDEFGIGAEIIDYRNPKIERAYGVLSPSSAARFKTLRTFARGLVKGVPLALKKYRFRRFVERNLNLGKPRLRSQEGLQAPILQYDILITGSDQVIGRRCTDFDPVYFLTSAPQGVVRASYAASMEAGPVPSDLAGEYERRLRGFDRLSVRENSVREAILSATGIDSEVHLDPTLIVKPTFWDQMIDRVSPSSYVLIYSLTWQSELLSAARRIASQRGLKVVWIAEPWFKPTGVHLASGISPERFVSLFANAAHVVTDSFHGTAFAIIFKKPFNVMVSDGRTRNERAEALLSVCGLSSVAFSNGMSPDVTAAQQIDWGPVSHRLDLERARSRAYLESVLARAESVGV